MDEQLQKVQWGEFVIGDLFDKLKPNKIKMTVRDLSSKKTNEFDLPVLTAGIENQGLNNYVSRIGKTILKNVISISANGANTGATFYQKNEFTVLQDAYAISFKGDIIPNDNQYLFLTQAISTSIYGSFAWTDKAGWEKVKKKTIRLPIKKGQIDFEFMDKYISQLKENRIRELYMYIKSCGIDCYILTEEERKAINEIDNMKLKKYNVGELFDIKKTTSFNKDRLICGNEYDYITRKSSNQGIFGKTGFISTKDINEKGTWSLGLLQMDFFYRKNPWYAGQFVRKIVPKIEINNGNELFFSTILNTLKPKLLTVLVRDINQTFLNSTILLPTQNGQIDFTYINTFVTAIKKMVIKDIMLYLEDKM